MTGHSHLGISTPVSFKSVPSLCYFYKRLQNYPIVTGNTFKWLLFIDEVFLDPYSFKLLSMF
jgi:hypothetical protein